MLPRIVVVGAGLAGLTCAYRLRESGFHPVVVEARERVGGRTWSVRLANGAIAEMGGEWIHSEQRAIVALAGELGVELAPIGLDFSVRDAVGADPIEPVEHHRVAVLVAERLAGLTVERRREMSAAEVLAGLDGLAADVLRTRLEGSAGRPLDEVAVDEIDGDFGLGGGTYLRAADGNQALCTAMADRVGDVRLSSPMEAVGSSSVRLADGEAMSADAVVVAIPPTMARRLRWAPEPHAVMDLIPMGVAAKMAMPVEAVPPIVARQGIDVPIWYWTGRGRGGSVRNVVASYAGTQPGVDRALHAWSSLAREAVPEVTPAGEPTVHDWSSDPWTEGAYSCLAPRQRERLDVFDRPHGRVVFAGEHTNGSGTMDGAVASGNRAARLVTELLA